MIVTSILEQILPATFTNSDNEYYGMYQSDTKTFSYITRDFW